MHVLVPVDGSGPSDDALAYALDQFGSAEITAVYVMDPVDGATTWGPGSGDDWLSAAESRAEEVLESAREQATAADTAVTTASVVGRPARAIVDYAEDNDIDHIVVGSHGRSGVSRMLLGSVAETVVRRSPVPVTVARSG
ncbi:UspA domain protein [Natronomonas pharaonis DSM 2160]|uniref:UspA domain protein n=1 Tax=Natronomonas pharaonis (strain ATCC 35678 / DSM 2160 / CIP 103997 / JCM 8858 / NBRC 14720 / NCIMB 2260 / Gabara) TaxID=348780 RepID=A0A1U7EU02_NATPD|nr:universal stress protein [Natronomonas pharaonis]CAI48420.1 UspA domain protein [Natronomonas pharaonis DSM 2160]